jgi:NAD(P)-dependent dehydrogenase (short-subunit alcohol dehydrogenase family)
VSSTISTISPSTKILIRTVDTKEEAQVKALFESLTQENITVNIVIDTAGSVGSGTAGRVPPSEWFNDFRGNVLGPYHLAHYMMSTYGDASGTFVVTGSLASAFPPPGMSSYSAAKVALERMIESLQLEHPKMAFFNLSPGNVKSPITNPMFLPFAKDTAALTGGWTVFLGSGKAEYMKGGFLNVNCR